MICEESKLDTRPRMQKVNLRVQDEPFTVVGNVEARDKHEGPSNSGMQTNGRSPVREQLHPRSTVHDERLKGEENMKEKIFENVLDRSKLRRIGFVCQTTGKKARTATDNGQILCTPYSSFKISPFLFINSVRLLHLDHGQVKQSVFDVLSSFVSIYYLLYLEPHDD